MICTYMYYYHHVHVHIYRYVLFSFFYFLCFYNTYSIHNFICTCTRMYIYTLYIIMQKGNIIIYTAFSPFPSTCTCSFITDLRKGVDDFMGRAFYLLRTIPLAGETRTLELYSRSAKSKCGTIKLALHISGRRRGLTPEKALEEYSILARAVVDYESKLVRK